MDNDLQKIMGCTCLRMRRATRRVTQFYDHALQRTGLTVNQFGLLAYLCGASLARTNASIGTTAEWLGMDPTTLTRNLKPLLVKGLVKNVPDPDDGRVRIVAITEKGLRMLREAVPRWRNAQAAVEKAIGSKSIAELNTLLDLSSSKLRAPV
ncbi:MAG TPA: MarR family winged helix-turn-helix transcriptional regulator [Xanthobacteraceae bacterium]|jgi:DNA-binding MarR family transcriptional regulator|nr:MarR family winged helix-turn-helix transcriptional regulator [Xanthobacteraceae bacterium]